MTSRLSRLACTTFPTLNQEKMISFTGSVVDYMSVALGEYNTHDVNLLVVTGFFISPRTVDWI